MKHNVGLGTARTVLLLSATLSFLFAACVFLASPAMAQSGQITLLHIGDTHSHLDAWGPKDANLDGTLGGLPKAATLIAVEKTTDPHALLVHAGDFMDGDLFFNEYLGVAELQLLKSLGTDAMVLGNHDLRLTPAFLTPVLQASFKNGAIPILGANLDITAAPQLAPWISATMLKDVNGIKVGILGLTVFNDFLASPKPAKLLPYAGPAAAAVAALRDAGAQVVICIAHIGMDASRQLAIDVPGIGVIVNGHDHAVLTQPEKVKTASGTTLIVSAGNCYRWVGRLRLLVSGGGVSLVDYTLLSADADTPALPTIQAVIDQLKAGIVKRYGDVYQPLALAELDLTAQWDPDKAKRDTALGNLFADAYRAHTGTDIAFEAIGFLGDSIPAGPVVGADVFRAMNFGLPSVSGTQQIVKPFKLVTWKTTGAALLDALDTTLMLGGNFYPQVSGLRLDYNSAAADPTHMVLRDTVHIGGHKIVANQVYSVTANIGVFTFLTAAPPSGLGLTGQDVQVLPDLAFDAARELVAQRSILGLATSNRIRDIAAIPGKQ